MSNFLFPLILFSQTLFAAPYCFDFFANYHLPSDKLHLEGGTLLQRVLKKDLFVIEDDAFYQFEGILFGDGILKITAQLSWPHLGTRSRLKGSEIYAEMIQHFGVENINTIRGIWTEGTNYEQYHYYLENGFKAEDAAAMTWSGRQAAKYGFTHVAAVDAVYNSVTQSLSIVVEFNRP